MVGPFAGLAIVAIAADRANSAKMVISCGRHQKTAKKTCQAAFIPQRNHATKPR
jgi:hypothetical protein